MLFNLTEEEWDDVIRIDLKGHFTAIKPAAVLFRQQRYGRIVTYSSVSGLNGNSGQGNYGAAKAGVAGLTRVAARDLGRYGVTVNCGARPSGEPRHRRRRGSSATGQQRGRRSGRRHAWSRHGRTHDGLPASR